MTTHPHARIARAWLHDRALPVADARTRSLGRITLLPHQEAAIAPLIHRLRRHRGALLADAPGLGKTFVALAVADALHVARPLVLAPAILRTRWLDAARETGTRIRFRSIESLGRTDGAPPTIDEPGTPPAFVIVDEAHHLRTVATRRWHAAAALVEHARVLLLSATPIHNRAADVAAIAALFHVAPGSRDLARLLRRITVRRPLDELAAAHPDGTGALRIPDVAPERRLALPPRDLATLDAIRRLPPLPCDDGHTGDARARLALVHAWSSSTAALAAMLRRRIARCIAIESACDAGVAPVPAVTRAWQVDADGTGLQLALAALLVAPPAEPAPSPTAHAATHVGLRATAHAKTRTDAHAAPARAHLADHASATARHRHALEALLRTLGPREDDARARALVRLARWGAAPVVAFTRSRTTARALWRRLRRIPGVALLTGDEAEIASGPVPRETLLAMLRDGAAGVAAHDADGRRHAPQAIRLLVATDVASEGISLAGTRTVVHLDRPWTPARLEQRVGRAARIGTPVDRIAVVALAPPVTADDFARVQRVLAAKAGIVARGDRALRTTATRDAVAIARLAGAWQRPPTTIDATVYTIRPPPGVDDDRADRHDLRGRHDERDDHDAAARGGDGRDAACGWLVALRVGRRRCVRAVLADSRVVRATVAYWRAAESCRSAGSRRVADEALSRVRAAIAAWWRARSDPLDRAARRRAHDARAGGAADPERLARVRKAVDAALAGASPLERGACGRGAARVRRRLATGVGARTLAAWLDEAAEPVRCRRWLTSLGRRPAGSGPRRPFASGPLVLAAVPIGPVADHHAPSAGGATGRC